MIFAGIVAGGKGSRIKSNKLPKQYIKIGDKTILEHVIEKFVVIEKIDKVYVGINEEYEKTAKELCKKYGARVELVIGGKERNITLYNIVNRIHEEYGYGHHHLISHDAARPFVQKEIINKHCSIPENYDAITTAVNSTDTIVEVDCDGNVTRVPKRISMYNCQTPQTFYTDDYVKILEMFGKENFTDISGLYLYANKKVKIIEGSYDNIKITSDIDLLVAEKIILNN